MNDEAQKALREAAAAAAASGVIGSMDALQQEIEKLFVRHVREYFKKNGYVTLETDMDVFQATKGAIMLYFSGIGAEVYHHEELDEFIAIGTENGRRDVLEYLGELEESAAQMLQDVRSLRVTVREAAK